MWDTSEKERKSAKLSTGIVSARIIVTVVSSVFSSVKHLYIWNKHMPLVWHKQGWADTEERYPTELNSDEKNSS